MEISTSSFWKYRNKLQTVAIVFLSISLALFSAPEVFAIGDVTWGVFGATDLKVDISDGNAQSGILNDVLFEVMDDGLVGPGLENVSVTITSNLDTEGITLLLSKQGDDGIIRNDKIAPLRDNWFFQINDTVTFSFSNICDNVPEIICDENVIDTISGEEENIIARSETYHQFVPIHLIETGEDTGVFEGTVKFTSDTSVQGTFPELSELQVRAGDTITISDFGGRQSNGLILPLPEDKGGILVEKSGSITITYVSQDGETHTSEADIFDNNPGSGGLGGPVNIGLVVDSSSSSGGGSCSRDCQPPTLGIDKNYHRIVEDGFSFNGNPVDSELFYTPYPLITVKVGEENKAVLKVFEDSGIENIAHVGLAFGLGQNEYFSDSEATINLDRDFFGKETVTLYDPENVLDNVKVVTEQSTCAKNSSAQCLEVTFYHTFREPLEFNMVGTDVWDQNRNSWQNFYNHGIEITGQSLNPPDEHIGIYKGNLVRLFETGKTTAIDEAGNNWTFHREWKMDFNPPGKIDDGITSHGYDRHHVMFDTYKRGQELIAHNKLMEILDGKSIQNDEIKEIKTIYYNILSRSNNPVLQKAIENEKIIAEILFSELYDKIQHNFLE